MFIFFFNDTATTEIYTLSLHDALPICSDEAGQVIEVQALGFQCCGQPWTVASTSNCRLPARSEEHTSELQSQSNLVCRLLLEKKKYEAVYDDQPAMHSGV